MDEVYPAWLLIGPTGSGKSPLGDALAAQCGWVHLDFGAWLRICAEGEAAKDLTPEERLYLRHLLARNALFAQGDFPLVRRLVLAFFEHGPLPRGVILNGLPRHRAQAESTAELFEVQAVVVLHCSPEAVISRVRRRSQGRSDDHAGREDDTAADVVRKLEIFARETYPLVDFYRRQGVPVIERQVEDSTQVSVLALDIGSVLAALGF